MGIPSGLYCVVVVHVTQKKTQVSLYNCVNIHTYTCTHLHLHMCQPLGPRRFGCTSRRYCLKDRCSLCSGQSPYVVPRLGCINAHGPLVPSIRVVTLTFLPLVRHRWALLWQKKKVVWIYEEKMYHMTKKIPLRF